MISNKVTGTLSPEAKEVIFAAIDEILENLPFAIDLTVEERKRLSKMGDGGWAFVERAHNLAVRNPDFLPRTFSVEEMTRDVELFQDMHPLVQAVKQMYERIEDTYKAVGADAFSEALAVYNYAKMSDPGLAMDEVLKDMSRRFSHKARTTVEDGDETKPDMPDETLVESGGE